jgi:putative CRISPR-associated protein (TIGR02619 family)
MKGKENTTGYRVFIVTVGLSVLTNYRKVKGRPAGNEEEMLDFLVNNYRDNPNLTSGEIKTLKLLRFDPGKDFVYLLTTDTANGIEAGAYIEGFLVKKLAVPPGRAANILIPGLQINDADRFLHEGAGQLMEQIRRIKEAHRDRGECLIVSTGGFKSVIPFLSDAGKQLGLELKYVFETENELIGLPPDRHEFYDSLKEPYHVLLARELLKARFTHFEVSAGCHPAGEDQIPADTMLREEFKKRGGRESYKALYYVSQADMERIRQGDFYGSRMERRWIRLDTVKALLGREMTVQAALKDDTRAQLPLAPGMLFILCLVEFCAEMRIDGIDLSWRAGEEQRGELVVEMTLKEPGRFRHAAATGGGKGIALFRKLLCCRSDTLLAQANEAERKEIVYRWPPQPLANGSEGHSAIYPRIIHWEVGRADGRLRLWWDSGKKVSG